MKHTTIDHSVLQAALVGFTIERDRLDALIAELRAELGQLSPKRVHSSSDQASTDGKKRFSAAARKRMALAQKKRWRALKSKKATAQAKPTATAKRKRATVSAARKERPVQVASTRNASNSRKTAPIRKAVPKPNVHEFVPPVQAAVEPAPTEVMA